MMDNLEERVTRVEERSKSNSHRLDEVEQKLSGLGELRVSIKVLNNRLENFDESLNEIKADVKSLTEKPAKRLDGIVDKIIGIVLGAVIGYLLIKIGIG